MKRITRVIVGCVCSLLTTQALAGWHTVTITSLYFVTDNAYATSDLPGKRLMVFGTFSPALPCAIGAFVLLPDTDQMFKETYAMLLAARLSGTSIQYYHTSCTPASGLGRGSLYQL